MKFPECSGLAHSNLIAGAGHRIEPSFASHVSWTPSSFCGIVSNLSWNEAWSPLREMKERGQVAAQVIVVHGCRVSLKGRLMKYLFLMALQGSKPKIQVPDLMSVHGPSSPCVHVSWKKNRGVEDVPCVFLERHWSHSQGAHPMTLRCHRGPAFRHHHPGNLASAYAFCEDKTSSQW